MPCNSSTCIDRSGNLGLQLFFVLLYNKRRCFYKRGWGQGQEKVQDSNVTLLYIWSQMFRNVPRFCATVNFTAQGYKVTYISSQILQKVERFLKAKSAEAPGQRNSNRNRGTATGKGMERQEQWEREMDEEHQGRD